MWLDIFICNLARVKGKHDYLKGFFPKFNLKQLIPWTWSDVQTNTETLTDYKCNYGTPVSKRHTALWVLYISIFIQSVSCVNAASATLIEVYHAIAKSNIPPPPHTPPPSAMSPTVLGKVVHDRPLLVGNDSRSLRVIILHHASPSTVRMHPQRSREGEWTVRRVTHRTHMDEDRRIGQAKGKKTLKATVW